MVRIDPTKYFCKQHFSQPQCAGSKGVFVCEVREDSTGHVHSVGGCAMWAGGMSNHKAEKTQSSGPLHVTQSIPAVNKLDLGDDLGEDNSKGNGVIEAGDATAIGQGGW